MTTQDLIDTLRQGAPVTARQVKAIVSQLERIPVMERTLAAKDRDFTQLSVAYTSAVEAGRAKGVQFTSDECGYVENALDECERLKEAVRLMFHTRDMYQYYPGDPGDSERFELWEKALAALRAVEELL